MICVWLPSTLLSNDFSCVHRSPSTLDFFLLFMHIKLLYASRSSHAPCLLPATFSSVLPTVLSHSDSRHHHLREDFHKPPFESWPPTLSHSSILCPLALTTWSYQIYFFVNVFIVRLTEQNINYTGRRTLFSPLLYIISVCFTHCSVFLLSIT